MKQYGRVVDIDGNIAKVECERQSACAACENSANCVEKCKKVYASASNEIKAEVGDMVEIETDTGRVILYSFVVFVVPVIMAVLSYFCADRLFGENIAVAVTFIVLVFSLILFAFVLNRRQKGRTVSRIVKILN